MPSTQLIQLLGLIDRGHRVFDPGHITLAMNMLSREIGALCKLSRVSLNSGHANADLLATTVYAMMIAGSHVLVELEKMEPGLFKAFDAGIDDAESEAEKERSHVN